MKLSYIDKLKVLPIKRPLNESMARMTRFDEDSGFNSCIDQITTLNLEVDINKLADIIKNFDADYVRESNFLAEIIAKSLPQWLSLTNHRSGEA